MISNTSLETFPIKFERFDFIFIATMFHYLPYELLQIIGSFIIEPVYKLKEVFQNVDWHALCMNPCAMQMIEQYPERIHSYFLYLFFDL